jgi:hypothetical protein
MGIRVFTIIVIFFLQCCSPYLTVPKDYYESDSDQKRLKQGVYEAFFDSTYVEGRRLTYKNEYAYFYFRDGIFMRTMYKKEKIVDIEQVIVSLKKNYNNDGGGVYNIHKNKVLSSTFQPYLEVGPRERFTYFELDSTGTLRFIKYESGLNSNYVMKSNRPALQLIDSTARLPEIEKRIREWKVKVIDK